MLTLCEVRSVSGTQGRFTVTVRQHPRYVNIEKCIACGLCAQKCPRKTPDDFNKNLVLRKAVYIPYAQAVPLKYAIDADQCLYFRKGKCKACEKFCPSGAIDFNDRLKEIILQVGSIILASGFQSFDPSGLDQYGYTHLPDVVTALEFERILSATGPYGGHLLRPSSMRAKGQEPRSPRKIAWLQCIGSRDLNRDGRTYCSSVCCMHAVKQTIIAKEHNPHPLDCAVFYMDMRTQGKDFDRFYQFAQAAGVRFIRSRVHSIVPHPTGDGLHLRYITAQGETRQEDFDMVVLSTGLRAAPETAELARRLGVGLDDHLFTRTDCFHPVATSVPGIYACGAFTGPKDIPQSVMEAGAAACAATEHLSAARHTRTHAIPVPPQRSLAREPARIGVFVCNCGINIGGVVRVPEVAAFARTLPGVVHVEENLFTCSQNTQDNMSEVIRSRGLNRIVVAACSPRTHEGLFQETLIHSGLNKFLVEMANIRNQDAWVHAKDPDGATEKAKDLVRMAVAKAARLRPLTQNDLPICGSALVVGGGLAGMTAALSLARQGFAVDLVEREEVLGGHARKIYQTFKGESVGDYVKQLIGEVETHERITVHTGTRVTQVEGFVGNYQSRLSTRSASYTIRHGVAILAVGAREYRPQEYLYGEHAAVLTHLELDALLRNPDDRLRRARSIVFIQCVGSRNAERPYCSKVCCTHTLTSALSLKRINPDMNIYVLYRDIRAYGIREDLYLAARGQDVLFFRYHPEEPPAVTAAGAGLRVEFTDEILERRVQVQADLLCLAAAIVPHRDPALAQLFQVATDGDGWFLEAHQKLRPVECAADGIYLCGMAHYPKPIEESIAQARAAASRALTILSRGSILVGGQVAVIDPEKCSGCLGCIQVCPYQAIRIGPRGAAEVNPALCKGCGSCAAACPSEAAVTMGFSAAQVYAQIAGALAA